MRLPLAMFALPLVLLSAGPASALSRHDWATASTIGEGSLAAAALGVPIANGDWSGRAR